MALPIFWELVLAALAGVIYWIFSRYPAGKR